MRAWMIGLAAVAAPIAVLGGAAMAADDTPRALTLERLFASPDLAGPQPRAMKLSPDGKLLTLLQDRAPTSATATTCGRSTPRRAQSGCWSNSKKVGTGAELTEAEKMQRERARIAGQKGIVAYDWAPDGKSILVPLDGDLYLATLDGKVDAADQHAGRRAQPGRSARRAASSASCATRICSSSRSAAARRAR